MLYGDGELDLADESVILDWITNNPTTMSEAAGHGVKEWKFFLSGNWRHDTFRGVDWLGGSPAVQYRYVQPETSNSTHFSSFLDERSTHLTSVPGPSSDILSSEFIPPSQADLYKHLRSFADDEWSGCRVSSTALSRLLMELRSTEDWGPELSGWLDPDALAKVTVPSQTSPGIRWKKLGYATKRQALMPAVVESNRLMRRMLEEGRPYEVPPAGVAGRGKRVITGKGGGDRKEGRLIVMPDLCRHLIGAIASGPYMAHLKGVDKSNGGVLLGMGPFSESYQRISEWSKGAKHFMFLDFKGFDQRIPAKLLQAVMKHISTRFSAVPGSRAYWQSEFNHLVNTEIAMPDGNVYRKKRGVASGDPWTSLAGSYANWLILTHCMKEMGLRAKIWTFGDDSVVAIYDKADLKGLLPRVTRVAQRDFGMVVSQTKSYVSNVLVDIEPDPEEKKSGSFLSLYFLQTPMGVRPTRPLQDLYEMFLVPERNRGDVQWEVVRTSMAYMTFYYNDTARYVLEEYWDWLHWKHSIPELTGTYRDLALLREMDIPWTSFKWEWLNRLPRPGEVELMYKYGHTGFYPPALWGVVYSRFDNDRFGNVVSRPPHEERQPP